MANQALIEALRDANAIQYGEFELSHGGVSEYYIDKYRFETNPRCLALIAKAIADRVDDVKLAGVALGGVPLVTATSLETGIPYVIARKAAKSYGTGNRIEGNLTEGEDVVVLEDVATTGKSAAAAVEALREAGAVVNRVIVVVDRQEGATDELAAIGVTLEALVTADELLEQNPGDGKSS